MAKVVRRGLDPSLLESSPVKPVDATPPAAGPVPAAVPMSPPPPSAIERTSTQTVKVPAPLLFEIQEHLNQVYRDTGARTSFQAFALEAIRDLLARKKGQQFSTN